MQLMLLPGSIHLNFICYNIYAFQVHTARILSLFFNVKAKEEKKLNEILLTLYHMPASLTATIVIERIKIMPDIKNNNINKVQCQNVITDKGVEQ